MIAMLAAIIITLIITSALGYAMRAGRNGIVRRPYNNRYSDATGARDDRLG
jgi:hypothetical protein